MTARAPTGTPPPVRAELAGQPIDLAALAAEICDRYHAHYSDEEERHGTAGQAWCRHDNQWLLSWAVGDVQGVTDLDEQACWLARVLHGRDFPIDRLAHNLRLAGEVARAHLGGDEGEALDDVLRRAARSVSSLALAGPPAADASSS